MSELHVQGSEKGPQFFQTQGNAGNTNSAKGRSGSAGFDGLLQGSMTSNAKKTEAEAPAFRLLPDRIDFEEIERTYSQVGARAEKAYATNETQPRSGSEWQVYKDEQLLSSPGGDGYDWSGKAQEAAPGIHDSFAGRVGKDLRDAGANLRLFFDDLFQGSERSYRDEQGEVRQRHQDGVLGSAVECLKDLGSALSFGLWRPDGEAAPENLLGRLEFAVKKGREALFEDALQGVPGGMLNMGQDLLLAGWNLVEAVPDAGIGHFESGRRLTTTIFDNGQVAIDYLTDILPSGEAWLRVHSGKLERPDKLKLPLLYNLQTPEHFPEDARWKYIRNTPFRKSIETIGSLLADAVTFQVLHNNRFFCSEQNDQQ